jgi:hypothetical protein
MMTRTLIVSFLGFSSLLFGQLDSNSVTVTASRSTNLQPDQVVFAVYVSSGLSTSLDTVLAALQPAGITIANFSAVGSTSGLVSVVTGPPPQAQPPLQWAFALPVPFSKMTATVATLTALQSSIMQNNSGLTMSFSVQGTQVSAQLQQSQACSVTDLISDASAKAQQLAAGAGLTLGTILAMASSTSLATGTTVPNVSLGFTSVSSILTVPQSCALTVKFALTRL